MKRISLILSLVFFILFCVSLSFWVMQFMKPEERKVVAPPQVKPVPDVDSVARLFGGALAVVTNYQLKGIILANPNTQSEAIIVADGKPAQAFTVNTEIATGVNLSEVHPGYVLISENGVNKRLVLPDDLKGVQFTAAESAPFRSSPGQLPGRASNPPSLPDGSFMAARNQRGRGGMPIPPGAMARAQPPNTQAQDTRSQNIQPPLQSQPPADAMQPGQVPNSNPASGDLH